MTRRYGIRPTVYRNEPGFHVYSIGGGGWKTSIFTPTRRSADAIKAKLLRGEEIGLADFA